MCFGFMSFCAPSAALKQKNYHNSPDMQLILKLFQVQFKFMKRNKFSITTIYNAIQIVPMSLAKGFVVRK